MVNFLWCLCRDCLPTAVALQNRIIVVDGICSWCREQSEDTMHILFHCSFAQAVYNAIGLQWLVVLFPSETIMDVIQRIFNAGTGEQCVLVGLLCWSLWHRIYKWM